LKLQLNQPLSIDIIKLVELVFILHNLPGNLIFPVVGSMQRTFVDILHAVMTNQFVILAVAIGLFLLCITLSNQDHSEAVIGQLWG
jgi:hypothetical protein